MLKESQVYNHWDIVYSCFVPDEMLSEHRLPIHALIYVYSGEMVVEDDGRTRADADRRRGQLRVWIRPTSLRCRPCIG